MKTSAKFFAALLVALPATVMANAIAVTNVNTINNTDTGTPGASIGDSFSIPSGSFASYLASPGEPQVTTDLASYGYVFQGNVSNVAGNVVDYTGSYRIFYDIGVQNDVYDAGTDTSISFGTATFKAIFGALNTAIFTGDIHQTQGPTGPFSGSFADLSNYYGSGSFVGTYIGNPLNPLVGTVQGSLELAVVPVPAAVWGGMALLSSLGFKRMFGSKRMA